MKIKKMLKDVSPWILYAFYAWFSIVMGDKTMAYFPFPELRVLPIFLAYLLIIGSGYYAIAAITMMAKTPNASEQILKFSAAMLVFGFTFILLSATRLGVIWIFVLSLIAVVLLLVGIRFFEEKFWNPVFVMKKKYYISRIKHEKNFSKADLLKAKYRDLLHQRMIILISEKERLSSLYMKVELFALKVAQKIIDRNNSISRLSEEKRATESYHLEKSTRM